MIGSNKFDKSFYSLYFQRYENRFIPRNERRTALDYSSKKAE